MRINRIVAAVTGLALASGGLLAAAVGTAGAQPSGVKPAVRTAPPGGPVPRGFRVASVTFVSANDGWVLGRTTKTCTHAPCTAVLRTTNGSRSWASIPAPKDGIARFNGAAGLDRLRFADSLDGFASGSQLWATHNGGSSWHRVKQVPGYITDLETSAGVVYAAGTVARSGKERIYISPVHSDSWQRVAGLPVAFGTGGLGDITLHGSAGGSSWATGCTQLRTTSTGPGSPSAARPGTASPALVLTAPRRSRCCAPVRRRWARRRKFSTPPATAALISAGWARRPAGETAGCSPSRRHGTFSSQLRPAQRGSTSALMAAAAGISPRPSMTAASAGMTSASPRRLREWPSRACRRTAIAACG